jgi:hypothetical protein
MRAVLFVLLLGAAPVSVDLPVTDAQFAPVSGVSPDAINANCLACHSVEMVTNQPRLTQAQWTATVAKMRGAFHAPVDPADDAAIIAWLTAWSAAQPTSESTR